MSVLPKSVAEAIKEYALSQGIKNPKFDISSGSRNGDSYSGDVYRIAVSSDEKDVEDCRNNNSDG